MEFYLLRRKTIVLIMLFNRVLSLLEEKFFNRLTRNWNKNILMGELNMTTWSRSIRPVHLAYKPYFFSQRTVFFSHNKSANSTFSHGLSAKRTGHSFLKPPFKKYLKPPAYTLLPADAKLPTFHMPFHFACVGVSRLR